MMPNEFMGFLLVAEADGVSLSEIFEKFMQYCLRQAKFIAGQGF
jgi:hypothetical protein